MERHRRGKKITPKHKSGFPRGRRAAKSVEVGKPLLPSNLSSGGTGLNDCGSGFRAARTKRVAQALRKGRYSETGFFYFVTTRTDKSKKLFETPEAANITIEVCKWLVDHEFIDLYMCMVMPDHVHLVFQLIGNKTLSQVMKSLKQYSSRNIKKKLSLQEKIWQTSFYDHGVRKNEDLLGIMRYCWYNPVRAGLVKNPHDYRYWWCKFEI
jgi:putative transposase